MNIIEVDKAKMEALQMLSDTNLKISEAKSTLVRLRSEEKDFLDSREKKVIERVEQALAESEKIVNETIKSYEFVKEYAAEVRNIAQAVISAVDLIVARDEHFDRRVTEWEKKCNSQEAALAQQKQVIESGHVLLNSEKESIKRQKISLGASERKLAADRASLDNAIKRLKEGRI